MPKYPTLRITGLYQLPGQERYRIMFSRYDSETGFRKGMEEFTLTPAELWQALKAWEVGRKAVGEAGSAVKGLVPDDWEPRVELEDWERIPEEERGL